MSFIDHIQQNDRFALANHIQLVQLTDTYAVAKAPIHPDSLNADGVAQGGFVFTLADLCFTYLSNHLHPRTITQAVSITYVAPGRGEWLWAKAEEVSLTRHNNVVNVVVTDDEGHTVAVAQVNGFIAPIPDEKGTK